MAKTENINIRIEPELKKEAEETLAVLDGRELDLPFKIEKPKYNKETLSAIDEAKKITKNPNNYKSFENIDELMEDLHN